MRVGFFSTCLVDLMRPSIGFAALRLLQAAGISAAVPPGQTCCGQPAYNSGDRRGARKLALKTIADFAGCDCIVVPSGSCAAMLRIHYPRLLDGRDGERAAQLARKTYELTEFLTAVSPLERIPGTFRGTVTYHDSCSGLRELGIKAQPRALLARMPGVKLAEMEGADACCGFGGTFSVKFGAISAHLSENKCTHIAGTAADVVSGGDLGCLLNIEGRLRRRGDRNTRVLHVAELLAGGGQG